MTDIRDAETLGDVIRIHGREQADKVALTFEGRSTTFGEFDRHASQVANGLIAAGVGKGDHVSYVGKNSDWFFEIMFGAFKAGAIMTPVNWRLAGPEIVYILNDAQSKVLFVGVEFLEQVRALAPELTHARLIVSMEGPDLDWPAFEAWRDKQSSTDPKVVVGWDDPMLQLYTSGTTGRPKGAMLSNKNLLHGRRNPDMPAWYQVNDTDISLQAMPNFHIGGAGWGSLSLCAGAKTVVAREFSPAGVIDFIQNDRISKMFMVPAAMQIVVRDPRARETDWSCMKYLIYGASPIPLALLQECMEVFGCGFVQAYGMTETTGTIVALAPEDHDPKGTPQMRSAGKPLPGVEVRILDEAGNVLKTGEVGEIATRSNSNMYGYWNLPEATAKTVDKEGWLRTGDAGYMDEQGFVYIHDRVKDMIISGGENVYPAEVENAIFGHPAVEEVAVIGVPDEKWGESVKAIVALKKGAEASPAEIIKYARERIAAYKAPKSVDFIEALPRNASGKILRKDLREPFWEGKTRRVN
ncbi:MAG: fatty acid--CoA ligase [Alphaproteobacteria bacterium]|nr:fatty acid--CoA ligase [Alphaproteobacteria bacterium]